MIAPLIRSLTANFKVPSSIPGLAMGLNIWVLKQQLVSYINSDPKFEES